MSDRKLTQVQRDIHQAIKLLNDRGWCQGSLRDVNGFYCLAGALRFTCLDDAWNRQEYPERYTAVVVAVAQVIWERYHSLPYRKLGACEAEYLIWTWNDKTGRTKADVMAVLNKAAARV